jgi:uncharacterized protein (TIGR02246 family)
MGATADAVAGDFVRAWETAWNEQGADGVARFYDQDAVLVGQAAVRGRARIAELFKAIIAQGWTGVRIRPVHVRRIGDIILIVNEYTALGSGDQAGKSMDARSSYVLARVDGEWSIVMHTAAA